MPSLHNGLTSNPALQAAYRRALGEMSQGFSGLERGSESLQPIMDLWALPEWAIFRGEILFSRCGAQIGAPGAGVFASHELVNPAGSNVLVVVLELVNLGASIDVSVDSGTALGALQTLRGVANDARFPQLGEVSQSTWVRGNTLVAPVALSQDLLGTNFKSSRPYIIQPGKKLICITNAANQASQVSILWYERRLVNNEQNP